jgi:hypothetical protein
MKATIVLGALLLSACGSVAPPTPVAEAVPDAKPVIINDRTMLNGAWQLVSYEQLESDGNTTLPFGDAPIGRLTFDEGGRLTMTVMKPGRFASVNSAAGIATATMDDLRQLADGYQSWYGTFRIEESTKTIIASIEAANIPAQVGTEQRRAYEVTSDSLTLIAPTAKWTWRKLP